MLYRHYSSYPEHIMSGAQVEDMIDLDTMDALKKAFFHSDYSHNGELELDEFKSLLKLRLHLDNLQESAVEALFEKVNTVSFNSSVFFVFL